MDINATQIVAEEATAHRGYQGEQNDMPMVDHLAETRLVMAMRSAIVMATRQRPIRNSCGPVSQPPKGHRVAALLAASAAYQADILNACEAHGSSFAIGAVREPAVNAAIAAVPEANWQPWRDGGIAETVHRMGAIEEACRLIVVRRSNQGELFDMDRSPTGIP